MRALIVDLAMLGIIAITTALSWFEPWYLRRGQQGIYWLSLYADDFTCVAGLLVVGIWFVLLMRRLCRSESGRIRYGDNVVGAYVVR